MNSPNSELKGQVSTAHFVTVGGKEDSGGVVVSELTKEKESLGKVLSVGEGRYLADGTLVKADLEVGDIVVFNPHLLGHEMKEDGETTILVSSNAIYGKYVESK